MSKNVLRQFDLSKDWTKGKKERERCTVCEGEEDIILGT